MISSFPVNVILSQCYSTKQERQSNTAIKSDICFDPFATENGYLPDLGLFFTTTNAEKRGLDSHLRFPTTWRAAYVVWLHTTTSTIGNSHRPNDAVHSEYFTLTCTVELSQVKMDNKSKGKDSQT